MPNNDAQKVVRLPNGLTAAFPGSMSNEQIQDVLRKQFPAPQPGFAKEAFSRTLGVSGPTEALSNIGTTFKWLMYDRSKLAAGATEYLKGTGKGLLELWREIGSTKYGNEAMEAFTGIGDFQDATRFMHEKKYRSAAGAASAGILKLLPLIPRAAREERAAETLASGEKLPVTRAVIRPEAEVARFEPVLAQLPGGGPLRRAYRGIQEKGLDFIDARIRETAAKATGRPLGGIGNVAETADVASRTIRDQARPLYASVEKAMQTPQANMIDLPALGQKFQTIIDQQAVKDLLSRPELSATLRVELEKIAKAAGGIPGGPADIYRAVTSARSKLLDAARGSGLSPYERMVARQMVRDMDAATTSALRSMNPNLAQAWLQANRLTRQGWAMKDVADALASAMTGTPESTQAGFKLLRTRAPKIQASKLIEALKDLSYVEPTRGGKAAGLSRLRQAFPMATDAKTIQQIAEIMDRTQQGGQLAGKLGTLGIIRLAGHAAVGVPAYAAGLAGHPVAAVIGVVSMETGAWVLSEIMATPGAGRLFLKYLQSVPGSTIEYQLAGRLNTLIDKRSMSTPRVASAFTPMPAPPAISP